MQDTISLILVALLFLSASALRAQTQPAGARPDANTALDTEPSIGPMRVRELPGFNYLYVTRNTNRAGIGPTVGGEVPKLLAAMKAHGISPVGPLVLTFHNRTGDPGQKFDMDIGIQVEAGTTAPDGYQLAHKPAAVCATIVFGGSLLEIGQAYRQLFGDLSNRDLIPTGETREYYLAWDEAQSTNNVIWIAVCAQ